LDYEPMWPASYETSLLHDSLVAQRLVNDRKARLIPGVPTNYHAAEYATRSAGAATSRHTGRRANHDVVAQTIDINGTTSTFHSHSQPVEVVVVTTTTTMMMMMIIIIIIITVSLVGGVA